MFILNDLKCYRSATFSSTNHFGTLIATEQHTRIFFGWLNFYFEVFDGFVFERFLTLSTLGGHNFLNSNPFLMIFSALLVPIGEVQVLFGHQKQWSFPLGSYLPSALKWSLMRCYTLYNRGMSSGIESHISQAWPAAIPALYQYQSGKDMR